MSPGSPGMSDNVAAFPVPPLEKSILVPCSPDRAFRAFTAEIAQWWPLATHSVAEDQARGVTIEPRIGGRVFETDAAGEECDWGAVLDWSPPHRLAMTWHPGRAASTAQTVEISFAAEAGGTRVTLRHHGWDIRGAKAEATRESYAQGWDGVFAARFVEFCRHLT